MKSGTIRRALSLGLAAILSAGTLALPAGVRAADPAEGVVSEVKDGIWHLRNNTFDVEIGASGQIRSLKIVGDEYPTNYVMNESNSPDQNTPGHEWMGELMFRTRLGDDTTWKEALTQSSDSGRHIALDGNKVTVTYEGATEARGISQFKLEETYTLNNGNLQWDIHMTNPDAEKDLVVGDLGLPMPFNEKWPGGEEIYETRTVYHSFVGRQSSYLYATRPSGIGHFLMLSPVGTTGAGFEYQDHWRTQERRPEEAAWCQDQGGWANGLNVFYIHSDAIKSTNRGYLGNTSLTLKPGEGKTYSFRFTAPSGEKSMKSILYNEGLVDAVSVPGMTFPKNMPAKLALHTQAAKEDISLSVQCPHETGLHQGSNTVSNNLPCAKNNGTAVNYLETRTVDGEQYHIYSLAFSDLGQNNVTVSYKPSGSADVQQTVLQYYIMDEVSSALETHSEFMVNKTQLSQPGDFRDKVFDDWMMDTKSVRNRFDGYWGWGDDWGLTHGEFLAEKNVYQPVADQIQSVDAYLDTAIWNGLMQEHQEDYKIHDFLMKEPNTTPTYRGYAYPHIYNTYFSMYQIASRYPGMVTYKEKPETYLLRAYRILKALYSDGVSYNWETGLMGELTTPAIIEALDREGYSDEAAAVRAIMSRKYDNFKGAKYPYGSEYSYDNTGEEAVYTLARMNLAADPANALNMMRKIDLKTRACRGVQPVWYHYANPTTICGENWWNFQYSAALVGYCMDDWLRLQDNQLSSADLAQAARVNYAAKLANLTSINSGQIDADPANIGAVAWTYQSEMGNLGAQGTGEGKLHNGWRQMSGEADLGLFGAMQILSADVSQDPVFGTFGYGCQVTDNGTQYEVTPLDGLFTKLNLLNEKISMELRRDQYTHAVVSKDGTALTLAVKNLEQSAHDSELRLNGMAAGSYGIAIDGQPAGTFTVQNGKTAAVQLHLPATATAAVVIIAAAPAANTAPVVQAGEETTVTKSQGVRLHGSATDDGYPAQTLTSEWAVTAAPADGHATLLHSNTMITPVSFDKAGDYAFTLTVSDGALSGSGQVTVHVTEDAVLPEVMATYGFENVTGGSRVLQDDNGTGVASALVGSPATGEGKDGGKGIHMNGVFGGYVKLPETLTQRVSEATISADIRLDGIQGNGARVFEFNDMQGHQLFVDFENANELKMGVTDLATGTMKTLSTGVVLAGGYWKNITLTTKDNTLILYVDGRSCGTIADTGFSPAGLGSVQRNFLGRSVTESAPFLKGTLDNFCMRSRSLSADEVLSTYGNNTPRTVLEASAGTVVTVAGQAPVLPDTNRVLYSDGIYAQAAVTWEPVSTDAWQKAGAFSVNGRIDGTDVAAVVHVVVVSGTIQNLAPDAVPSAIIDTPSDLGGVKGLNDGFVPASSRDTSHGVWHNWHGNQGGPAWVEYDWADPLVLTGADAYYFTDGNFAPATAELQYKDENGAWVSVKNPQGLGVELNTFNKTTFDPVQTKGIRMVMNPKTQGIGVIEWRVFGYSDKLVIDRSALQAAVNQASALKEALFTAGWDHLLAVKATASAVLADKEAGQKTVDDAAAALKLAIISLVPAEQNMAYLAQATTTYVSPWEKLTAVQDGVVSQTSAAEGGIGHYGTWGNESASESIIYSWPAAVKLNSTAIFFWDDGGGIHIPKTCTYQYMDANGNWADLPEGAGYGLEKDIYNVTTFAEISTTALKVTMEKINPDGDGVGVLEWKVTGKYLAPVDKTALRNLIAQASGKTGSSYTTESWAVLATALQQASGVSTDAAALQNDVDNAANVLQSALGQLVLRNSNSGGGTVVVPVPTPAPVPVKTAEDDLGRTRTSASLTAPADTTAGISRVRFTEVQIQSALEQLKKTPAVSGLKQLELKTETADGTHSTETRLPLAAVQALAGQGIDRMAVSSQLAELSFDAKAVRTISGQTGGDISIRAGQADTAALPEETRRQLADRPVYEFSVTSGSKAVTEFGGQVTVAVPYTLKAGERPESIVVWYVRPDGTLQSVGQCTWDSGKKMVRFSTTHFSTYAIGYRRVEFKDVSKDADYADAVAFITSRGIAVGTGDGNFEPESTLTRAEFLVMLLRALNIQPDEHPADNFADAGDTWYTGFLSAAKRLKVASGVGSNLYAPDSTLTREELCTLVVNAMKVTETLPVVTGKKKISDYRDGADIQSWAADSISRLVGAGVFGENTVQLRSRDKATRAEMAQLVRNILNLQAIQ